MKLLGIDVSDELLARWQTYLAPEWQPFFVDAAEEWGAPVPPTRVLLTDDLRDTYKVWRMRDRGVPVWFDEDGFMSLPRDARARLVREQVQRNRGAVPTVRRCAGPFDAARLRAQADGHRFVWWPSLVAEKPADAVAEQVLDGQPASRHREVRAATWRSCERVLPRAHDIAGKFAQSSGPNCFGTTLAAAGHADTNTCVVQQPFEEFLSTYCAPGGNDGDPGTVLVWRDSDGQPVHSAVTLGDGWALEKPAQTWWTPRIVLEVHQLIKANRCPGQRVERHRIVRSFTGVSGAGVPTPRR